MAPDPEEERPFFAEDEGGPVKSFLEHLEDFRWTVVKSAVAICIGILIGLVAGNRVMAILIWPLQKAVVNYTDTNQLLSLSFGTNRLGTYVLTTDQKQQLNLGTNRFVSLEIVPIEIPSGTNQIRVLGLRQNSDATALEMGGHRQAPTLIALGPAHAFLVGFRVAIYAGIALASPFIFYFVGQFVIPALKVREKTFLLRGMLFAVPLFLCGVSFCYFVLMPTALAVSQSWANWYGFDSNLWDAGEYIDFICKFMLGMGLGFELPVVLLMLVRIGILDYAMLKKARPYMVIINLVLGSLLTTPEIFTQVLMAVPLQMLFEISVFVAWYWERRDKKRAAREANATIDV